MSNESQYASAEDKQLVRLSQKGNTQAFEELVARHRDKIYARAYSMMRNEEGALDLSQEAWIKAWQRLAQFQGDSSFATWMTRIVINLCLDQLRRQKRVRSDSIEEMEYKEIARTMGCSIGTIMSRLFYARRRMAGLLGDLKRRNEP